MNYDLKIQCNCTFNSQFVLVILFQLDMKKLLTGEQYGICYIFQEEETLASKYTIRVPFGDTIQYTGCANIPHVELILETDYT